MEESKPLACLKSCAMHTHNVKNNKIENVLKLPIAGEYYRVGLSKNKKTYMLYPHELVAKYFLDNPDNKSLIYHMDNNKFNNNVNNLCYYNIDDKSEPLAHLDLCASHTHNLYNCLEGEIFKKINGYDNYYISNLGRVKSNYFNRENIIILIFMNRGKEGYYYFNTKINKKIHKLFVHRLVAEHFIENPKNKPCVDHINRISTDNCVTNLRWTTTRENSYNLSMLNTNTSGYMGVYKDKKTNKWIAAIRINGKKTHLGRFIDIEDAAKAYDDAKNLYHIIN